MGGRLIVDKSSFHAMFLMGGDGNDTIVAEGADIARGGDGEDVFVLSGAGIHSTDPTFPDIPLAPLRVADFTVGQDRLVLPNYNGSDPIADGYIRLEADGVGTKVLASTGATIAVIERVDLTGLGWSQIGAPRITTPIVGIGATSEVSEGGRLGIAFIRYGDLSGAMTVNWSLAGDGEDPASAADFGGAMTGMITFKAGESVVQIEVPVAQDPASEGDEGYAATITGVSGGIAATGAAKGVILNDDAPFHTPPGNLYVSSGPGAKITGGAGADTLQGSSGHDVLAGGRGDDVFTWTSAPTDWSSIVDFRLDHDHLDFSRLFQQVGYTGDDPVADGYIAVAVQNSGDVVLFDPDGKGPAPMSAVVRVENLVSTWARFSGHLPRVDIQAEPVTQAEGDNYYGYFSFIVTRSGPLGEGVSVNWRAVGEGANPASYGDLAMGNGWPTGSIEFAPGETSKVIKVQVAGDTTIEPDETFRVELYASGSATIGRGSVSATIVNDDHPPPPPQIGFESSSVSLAEGNPNTGGSSFINFTVKRSGSTTGSSTVDWRVTPSGEHPTDSTDFISTTMSGTLTFQPGETSKTIGLQVRADTTPESDETFTVTLSNVTGATLAASTAAGVILNDDGASPPPPPPPPPPTDEHVYNSPGPGSKVTAGSGDDTLNASRGPDVLTGGAGHDTFAWAKEPWAPAHITDFVVGTDRLDLSRLFQAGGYTGSDPVADKYVWLIDDGAGGTKLLFDKDGAAAGQQWPNYIIDLEHVPVAGLTWAQLTGAAPPAPPPPPPPPPPVISFSTTSLSLAEGNSGATAFSFTVTRSGDTSGVSDVVWSVNGSGANPASSTDFAAGASGAFSFAPGETSRTIVVSVGGDTTVEPDETFTVSIGASGATLGTARATGTILNDDTAAPPPPPPSTGGGSASGHVYNSPGPGSKVTGDGGDDTLNASQGPDVLTGGAGHDTFAWAKEPWAPTHVTDFVVGTDRLDLSALFQAAGYTGADPIADKYVWLIDDGAGGTKLLFDKDGAAAGQQWPNYIIDLEHVPVAGLTWAQLSGAGAPAPTPPPQHPPPPPPPPPSGGSGGAGQTYTSATYGDTLSGGAGDDTLNAGQGPDRLTGSGGADRFVFAKAPWNAGHVTDFTPGVDKLDLRGLFAGHAGGDPLADHRLEFRDDGHGNTQVYVDADGPNTGDWPFLITTLDHVAPGRLGAADWIIS